MTHNFDKDKEQVLKALLQSAIEAAQPDKVIRNYLPSPPKGKTVVVGCGKAAASMALAFEKHWKYPVTGLVITMNGHSVPTKFIEVVEANHPVPDSNGHNATVRIMSLAKSLGSDDLLIFLVSGGGSALMPLPAEGISLSEKQLINAALLKSGADIFEMNAVRKHISAIKGGKLALAAYPAKVITLAISDIPGDDPTVIASGPTLPDSSTLAEALAILKKYDIDTSKNILTHLKNSKSETPKPEDPRFRNNEVHIIATPQKSLEAAALMAKQFSLSTYILSDQICGESKDVAQVHGALAIQIQKYDHPIKTPCIIFSGGETTVTVNGNGRGGRNVEFLLSLAIYLSGNNSIWAIAADTDGIDGTEKNAGAIINPTTLSRSRGQNMDAKLMLQDNNAYDFFLQLEDIIITGPTRTNVNDFRAILIEKAK